VKSCILIVADSDDETHGADSAQNGLSDYVSVLYGKSLESSKNSVVQTKISEIVPSTTGK